MMDLDVRTEGQVASHQVLDADLGVGGRHLIVISGIVVLDWKVDDDTLHRETCRLRLAVPAGTVEQSTVYTGLASVANDDTAFTFATDRARLEVDHAADELILVTDLAVGGEPSSLNRFSYQIVLTTRIVVSEISGTITWPTAWFRPSSATPSAVADTFTVKANVRTVERKQVGVEGGFGGQVEVEHLDPITPGQIVSVEIGDQESRATYRITDPPKGRELKVTVTQQGLQGPQEIWVSPVQQGGDVLTLTVGQPSRVGVDFNTFGRTIH